jgi:DNA-directed RNA polymerase subunit RPC12/RpoP
MPRTSHRLDLFVMPADLADPPQGWNAGWDVGLQAGWWEASGKPGPAADALVEGGYVRARLETHDGVRMISNQQGGFQVRCPSCRSPMARPFGDAVTAWRGGAERAVTCPTCGTRSPLEAVDCRPAVGFARGWLHLADVGRFGLGEAAAALEQVWGPLHVVGRRTN